MLNNLTQNRTIVQKQELQSKVCCKFNRRRNRTTDVRFYSVIASTNRHVKRQRAAGECWVEGLYMDGSKLSLGQAARGGLWHATDPSDWHSAAHTTIMKQLVWQQRVKYKPMRWEKLLQKAVTIISSEANSKSELLLEGHITVISTNTI
jgi:hypothetical protein